MKDETFDHLAEIFLSTNKKALKKSSLLKSLVFLNILLLGIIIWGVYIYYRQDLYYSKNLVLAKDTLRLDYDFSSLREKELTFNFNTLDLSKYSTLVIKARSLKDNSSENLKIEIENIYKEKDIYYLKNINSKWNKFFVPLNEFKKINDWHNIKRISFIVESWNINKKRGVIFLDYISFSTQKKRK